MEIIKNPSIDFLGKAKYLLTVQQAAELSGYHPNYVRQIIRTGKVKARKFATVWHVSRTELLSYTPKTRRLGAKRGPKRRA